MIPGNEHSQASSSASAEDGGVNLLNVVRIIRSAGGALLAQASLHGQLACVEWKEEKTRLKQMLVTALSGFAFLLCFMIFAGVLVTAITWDTQYRIVALVIVTLVYGVAGFLAFSRFNKLSERGSEAFAATREEIAADIALIKSKL